MEGRARISNILRIKFQIENMEDKIRGENWPKVLQNC